MEDLSKNYTEDEAPLSSSLPFEERDRSESNENMNTTTNGNVTSAQTSTASQTKTTTKQNTSHKRNLDSDEVQIIKEIKEVKARTPSTPVVLDDDAYVSAVDSIIQRDFFPDLPKLRAQLEWLEATEGGDIERLRTLQKYIVDTENQLKKRKTENTVSNHIPFETPNATPLIDSTSSSTPFSHRAIKVLSDTMKVVPPEGIDVNLSLDDFQSRHTSEDSASFDLIMEKHKQKLREKYAWAYEAETSQKLITSSQQQQPTLLLEESKYDDNDDSNTSNDDHVNTNTNNENAAKPLIECGQGLLTWSHTAKNQLMYTPDGYKSLNLPPPSTKEIHRNNTRFQSNPFPIRANKNTAQQQQQVYSMISLNGELNPLIELRRLQALGMAQNESNINVNNINNTYVPMTPSISPSSLGETPFVTWGKIDGTPLLLDPSATPSGGPTFRVPEPLPREKVAIKLQEQASQKIKEKARLNAVGKKSTPQNGGMSPAVKELMKGRKSAENYDKKLRQSYSSPSPRIFEAPTPKPTFRSDLLTPEPSKIRTPK